MLSNVDIVKELNKNIFIYPLTTENIRGSSINLTASKWAWSLKTKKSLLKTKNNEYIIEIDSKDTALIETEEIIYISNKISGTYHSKVKLVSKGLGHIGTTLDPGWCGNSLIALHNHSKDKVAIKVGETFVTLVLNKLNSNSTTDNTNPPGQIEILTELGISSITGDLTNEWRKNKKNIIEKCNEPDELIKIEKLKKTYQKKFYKNKLFLYLFILIICFGLYEKFSENPNFNIYISIAFSGIFVQILNDLHKFIND